MHKRSWKAVIHKWWTHTSSSGLQEIQTQLIFLVCTSHFLPQNTHNASASDFALHLRRAVMGDECVKEELNCIKSPAISLPQQLFKTHWSKIYSRKGNNFQTNKQTRALIYFFNHIIGFLWSRSATKYKMKPLDECESCWVIGASMPTLQDLYTFRVRKWTEKIIIVSAHPSYNYCTHPIWKKLQSTLPLKQLVTGTCSP